MTSGRKPNAIHVQLPSTIFGGTDITYTIEFDDLTYCTIKRWEVGDDSDLDNITLAIRRQLLMDLRRAINV